MRFRISNRFFSFLILFILFLSLVFSNIGLGMTDRNIIKTSFDDSLDQYQLLWSHGITVANPDILAQSFTPEINIITRLELLVHKTADTPNNLTISIRSSKNGPDLTSATVSSVGMPSERSWVEFDFPDLHVNISNNYYIIFNPQGFSMVYFWWGYDNHNIDSYNRGEGWLYTGGNWVNEGFLIKDFCFKTYGFYESLAPSTPQMPNGTIEGLSWHNYQYNTISSDPDMDEVRYGWDWDGDNFVDEWTGYYLSGEICTISHYWTRSGSYTIKVKAEDTYGVSSNFSLGLVVNITNDPPIPPEILSGETVGVVGQPYSYNAITYDPDQNDIRYGWDWNGDSIIDEWTDLYPSGFKINITHTWNLPGTYYIKVRSEDELNSLSDFSDTFRVIIVDIANDPPIKPSRPIGPSIGRIDVSHSFGTMTTDPNGDRIYYMFDWDDGSMSDWIGPFSSGQPCNISHTWSSKGTFQIKVKARDEVGYESVWSDPLAITMPKTSRLYFFNRILSLEHILLMNK